jgi:hypothetical protein
MKNKTNNKKLPKTYLPSIVVEDKTHIETNIDPQGNMKEVTSIIDDLDEKIEPPSPTTPRI